MARPKTVLNQAAEQFKCPTCTAKPTNPCINVETATVVPTHRTRQNLVCQQSFLNFPATMISGGLEWSMICARKAGHHSQHQTFDKRLTWSQDYGVAEGRALYDELMAKTG